TCGWRDRLRAEARSRGKNLDLVRRQTDNSDLSEGLYIKVEIEDRVVERYKLVRASFLQSVSDSGSHWMDRPVIPNRLRAGCDIFGGVRSTFPLRQNLPTRAPIATRCAMSFSSCAMCRAARRIRFITPRATSGFTPGWFAKL